MRLTPGSIKGRLFLWIFLFTSSLLMILGASLYYEFRDAIFNSIDNTLHSKLQIMKGLLHEEHDTIEFELDEIILGEYSIPLSGHYYKIEMNGQVEAASESLTDDNFNLTSGKLESHNEQLSEWIYTSTGPAGEPIRVVRHDFEFLDVPTTVFIAESIDESLSMLKSIKISFFVIASLSILIIGAVGFLIVRHSLHPLDVFSSKIKRITHKTLGQRIDVTHQAEEIKGLARSFNEMLDRLQRAFESEKRLIADASHELKTPLSVIKTEADVLLQKERTTEEYIKALNTIQASSGKMKKQINDMLTLARLDSGLLTSADFTTISITDCLENAIQIVDVLAEKKRIKITSSLRANASIRGDMNRLTEAFSNIMENAIRYSSDRGRVAISVSKKSNQTKIMIKDNGAGISQNDLDRVFDRFYRADTPRRTEGTGLGLSIAKAIIEAHNGNIKVESEVNKGSSFIVEFPG